MKQEVKNWDETKFGRMTFQNICRLYSSDKNLSFSAEPPYIGAYYANDGENMYAVRWNRYENNADFTGWCVEQIKFVLNGESEINIEGNTYHLRKGQYIQIPTGNYHFKMIGKETFEYVIVCKLPDNFPS